MTYENFNKTALKVKSSQSRETTEAAVNFKWDIMALNNWFKNENESSLKKITSRSFLRKMFKK